MQIIFFLKKEKTEKKKSKLKLLRGNYSLYIVFKKEIKNGRKKEENLFYGITLSH